MLAENDGTDELRQAAEAGDDHARRQLASWLSERDEADELQRRASAGDPYALHHLAGWLAEQGGLAELRELLTDHRELLASSWAAAHGQHQREVLHLMADLGDENARRT